jgi:hypothetical protein
VSCDTYLRAAAERKLEAEESAARAAAQQADAQAAMATAPKEAYQRREGVAYAFTPAEGQPPAASLLDTPMPALIDAVTRVVQAESPVHLDDLAARVAALWDARLGSRIHADALATEVPPARATGG